MKFFITFKIQNQEFDSKYAKEYHFGKESDGNRKDLWSIGFKLSDNILEYKETKDFPFELKRKGKDNTLEIFQIADVTIVKCLTDKNDRIEIVVSNKLISKTHVAYNPKYDTTRYYFYLKHDVEYCMLSDYIYLAKTDIPGPDFMS